MKYNKYKNIFNYYRGQSYLKDRVELLYDKQIEDNTTKALINTLQNISENSQLEILRKLKIITKGVISFDLQPPIGSSRPDALIVTKEKEYYIESKVESEIDINQLKKHIENIGMLGELIVITNYLKDNEKIFNADLKLNFITWNEIWLRFREIKTTNDLDYFLINQFLNYLEDNNMTEFNGWNERDFDSFLSIEEDNKCELRRNVKLRFIKFIEKLELELKKTDEFSNVYFNVMTAIRKDTESVWGNFIKSGKRNIQIAHLWLDINANGLDIGIQNEGINSTRQFINKLINNPQEFTSICKNLNGYNIHLKERFQIQVQNYGVHPLATINLGHYFTETDTLYLINKIKEFNNKIEVTFFTHFKRDRKDIQDVDVIDIIRNEFLKLFELYNFNQK